MRGCTVGLGDGLVFIARQARSQSRILLPKMKITTKS